MNDPNVGRYQVLPNMPDPDFALSRMKKMVSLVRPIMRKHNLYVQTFGEFYPPQDNLLGVNYDQGRLIEVRLRCTQRTNEYLPTDAVIDTFLHELAHIAHPNHGQQFKRTWEMYRTERQVLIKAGYRGEGMDGPGIRLGGGGRRAAPAPAGGFGGFPGRGIPVGGFPGGGFPGGGFPGGGFPGGGFPGGGFPVGGFPAGGFGGIPGNAWAQEVRGSAAMAAERRRMFAGSGQKLGGSSTVPPSITLDDGTRIVAGCLDRPAMGIFGGQEDPYGMPEPPVHTSSVPPSFSGPYNEEPGRPPSPPFGGRLQQVIEIDDSDSDSDSELGIIQPPMDIGTETDSDSGSGSARTWQCPMCTFINPDIFLCCDACQSQRPVGPARNFTPHPTPGPIRHRRIHQPPPFTAEAAAARRGNTRRSAAEYIMELDEKIAQKPLGWSCRSCGTFMETKWWTCSMCGTMKEEV